MKRKILPSHVFNNRNLEVVGLSRDIVAYGINFSYEILDSLDETLVSAGAARLPEMVELANLSAIIGNFLRTGIAHASGGGFAANLPHKYPDLMSRNPGIGDLEIKVALEANSPKGHLPKPGNYLTCRYVLGTSDGGFTKGKENRGDVVWIWEIRVGSLEERHFNISSTSGDSGKTAVISADGLNRLNLVYCSMEHFPASQRKRKTYEALIPARAGP